jgi:hypothetical protein
MFVGFGDISSALKAADCDVRGLLFSTRSFDDAFLLGESAAADFS